MRWVRTTAAGSGAVALLLLLLLGYNAIPRFRLAKEVEALKREKEQLLEYAHRLSASRRVAQVNVLSQFADESGRMTTRLLWQEVGPDGLVSLPVDMEVVGTLVYFEAFVLKFDYDLVGNGDRHRSTSLALFRRIFGDLQVPDEAPMLDQAGALPAEVRRKPGEDEERLWERFWEFMDDPQLAAQYGVRVAQCEAPAVSLHPGQVWQVTLDAPGGLNLKRVLDLSDLAHSPRELP